MARNLDNTYTELLETYHQRKGFDKLNRQNKLVDHANNVLVQQLRNKHEQLIAQHKKDITAVKGLIQLYMHNMNFANGVHKFTSDNFIHRLIISNNNIIRLLSNEILPKLKADLSFFKHQISQSISLETNTYHEKLKANRSLTEELLKLTQIEKVKKSLNTKDIEDMRDNISDQNVLLTHIDSDKNSIKYLSVTKLIDQHVEIVDTHHSLLKNYLACQTIHSELSLPKAPQDVISTMDLPTLQTILPNPTRYASSPCLLMQTHLLKDRVIKSDSVVALASCKSN